MLMIRFVLSVASAVGADGMLAGPEWWSWWLRMRCKACGRTIPEDALLCPYCGQSVFLALPSPRSHARPLQEPSRRRSRALLAYLFLMCCACCLLAAVALFAVYSPSMADGWERLRERISNLSSLEESGPQPLLWIASEGSSITRAGSHGFWRVVELAETVL